MFDIQPLEDGTRLLDDPQALRARWLKDGVLYLKGINDPGLMAWAEQHYRKALIDEGLIEPGSEAPVWTGKTSNTWRPCDAIGTTVWHEVIKQPKLNAVLRLIFECDPVWVPIVAHRSAFPRKPLEATERLLANEHQDAFYNEGMNSTICWMPVRDVKDLDSGTFAVAPGSHRLGILHDPQDEHFRIPEDAVPTEMWRSAAFRVGDLLIFRDDVVHAAIPNLSPEFRLSLDIRVGPASAPRPVSGTVEEVAGLDVSIRDDASGELVTVHVDDGTFIRDMNPHPPVPTAELTRIAFPGARVLAMAGDDRRAKVLRRNFY